jgi:hypothetical protein
LTGSTSAIFYARHPPFSYSPFQPPENVGRARNISANESRRKRCSTSLSPITNGTSLDQFIDVSFELSISSSTIAAGANLAVWLMPLMEDGSTYSDNSLSTSQAAVTPPLSLAMFVRAASFSTTALYGYNAARTLVIPPGTWLPGIRNNSGFTLSSFGNTAINAERRETRPGTRRTAAGLEELKHAPKAGGACRRGR